MTKAPTKVGRIVQLYLDSLWGNYTGLTTTDQIDAADGTQLARHHAFVRRAVLLLRTKWQSNNGPCDRSSDILSKAMCINQLSWLKGRPRASVLPVSVPRQPGKLIH